ncbi:MAG: 6-carboxytetrahydropterin synthase [Acidobacteriales bacterium]|nr:6-carboxytetrahydropterin synthase [Terriglobales bacterium]
MRAYLTRRYLFPASHRLHNDKLSPAENDAIYGRCNNPHGHGHNYALEVTVGGPVDPATGMVCDLADLDGFIRHEVLARFDHANLNTLPAFAGRVPTTENLCLEIFRILQRGFRVAAVERIRLEETRKNSFEFGNVRP